MTLLDMCHEFGLKVCVRSLNVVEIELVFRKVRIYACMTVQEEVEACEVVERVGCSDRADVLVSVWDAGVCVEPLNGVVGALCERGERCNVRCDEGTCEENSSQLTG